MAKRSSDLWRSGTRESYETRCSLCRSQKTLLTACDLSILRRSFIEVTCSAFSLSYKHSLITLCCLQIWPAKMFWCVFVINEYSFIAFTDFLSSESSNVNSWTRTIAQKSAISGWVASRRMQRPIIDPATYVISPRRCWTDSLIIRLFISTLRLMYSVLPSFCGSYGQVYYSIIIFVVMFDDTYSLFMYKNRTRPTALQSGSE